MYSFKTKLTKSDLLTWQSVILVRLFLHPTPLPNDVKGCNDVDKSGEKYPLNKCLHMHFYACRAFVCNIWKGLSYFWSQEERSRDGVWSPNRGASLLLGKGEKERREEWSVGGGGGWGMVDCGCPVTLQPVYDFLSVKAACQQQSVSNPAPTVWF